MLVAINTPGTKGFFQWMERALPKTYAGVKRELSDSRAPSLKGLGDLAPALTSTTTAMSSSLSQTIQDIATVAGQVYLSAAQVKAQQSILNLQLERARQGLPPLALDPTTYGLPQPTLGISLSASTQKLLMYGGIGLALALMLGLIGGGRASRRH